MSFHSQLVPVSLGHCDGRERSGGLGGSLPHAARVPPGVVSERPRPDRVRVERVRRVAGARVGSRERHAPAGHGSPRRPARRHADARRRGRPLVPGRDRRRVRAVARPAVLGRRDATVPRGRPARLERGPGAGAGNRRRRHQRPRGIRGARVARRRTRARAPSLVPVPSPRERERGRLPPRRPLGRRDAALSRARGARRPHPSGAPRGRPAHRRDRRRAARRGDVAGGEVLVTRPRRSTARLHA